MPTDRCTPICVNTLWRWAAWSMLFLLSCNTFAQNPTLTPSQASVQSILDAPVPGELGSDNRVFAPARIFNRAPLRGVDYDLKTKPEGKGGGGSSKLYTTVETKVENKTTNYVGGGGGGGWGGYGGMYEPPRAPPAAPGGAPPKTYPFPFPDLVEMSVGKRLPLFGSELFASSDTHRAGIDPLTIPADYRVGPGDELIIRAWGQIDIDSQSPIDRSGQVFLPKIGNITVAGLKLSEIEPLLKTTIGKQFKGFELTVTLGALRTIQYYVMGFAQNPGIHMTESTSTALRGLLMSGGPLPSGDLRRIEVRRGDRVVATIDAYKFVIDGDKSSDPQLQPGDVIFVPPAKGYAAMAGSVHRPMIYHLTEGMVLADLLKAAGGLSMNLGQAKVQLERMPDGRREVERFILTEADLKRPVANGDLFMILPIDTQFRETVTLRGNVDRALRQQWRDGMRVSDLIGSPSNLVRPAIWSDLNKREDLAALESSRRDTTLRRDFPEVEWDHAMIERLDPVSLQVSFLPFNLGRALMRDALHNLTLQPGDSVVIYAKGDFQQPQRKRTRLVKVEGEVNSPGIYPVALDETLPEVLARAGGLTSQAYVYGTEFLRERVREAETKRHRQAVDMIEQDYLRYLTGRARNATTNEEAGISTVEYESVRNLVARLREFQPLGRIPLNLSNHKATFSSYPGVRLEDNDVISVPPRLSTVTVVGIVFQEGAQLWVPGWTVHDYIQNAGGERPHADLPNAVILRADGTVRQVPSSNLFSTNWGGTAEINPGDTIMVPENVTRTTWGRIFRDWSQIFYQLGLGAAAVQVFKINSTK